MAASAVPLGEARRSGLM